MPFEQTPGSPRLDEQTINALRGALGRSIAQRKHEATLRELLCATALEARDKGIQAEQLLIILKDIWFSLPELANARALDADNSLLQELISHCIQEYYAL